MVKLFIGNLADGVAESDLKERFEMYGTVTECSVLGNYGFVHMSTEIEADDAIKNLDKTVICGKELNVERGKSAGSGARGGGGGGGGRRNDRRSGNGFGGGGFSDNSSQAKSARRAGCTKLHVASLPDGMRSQELRVLFERYGYVAECDVVEDRKIAFVHIENGAADAAIRGLDGREFRGVEIRVQMSKNQNNDPGPSGPGRFGERGRRGRGDGFGFGGLRSRGFGFGDYGDDGYGYDDYDVGLPPPAKGRMELLELLDRRRHLEALDPYERRLISSPDPFNLPPPPPEYLRLLRERAMVKARLPLPPASGSLAATRAPSAQTGTSTATLQRALIARRAAAVAANAREKLRSSASVLDAYDDGETGRAAVDDYLYGGMSGMTGMTEY